MIAEILREESRLKIPYKQNQNFVLSHVTLDPHSDHGLLYVKIREKQILISQLRKECQSGETLNLELVFEGQEGIQLRSKEGNIHLIGRYVDARPSSQNEGKNNDLKNQGFLTVQNKLKNGKNESSQTSKTIVLEKEQEKNQEVEQPIRRSSRRRAPPPPTEPTKPGRRDKQKDVLKNMAKLFELNEEDLDDDEEDESIEQKAANAQEEDEDNSSSSSSSDQDFQAARTLKKGALLTKKTEKNSEQMANQQNKMDDERKVEIDEEDAIKRVETKHQPQENDKCRKRKKYNIDQADQAEEHQLQEAQIYAFSKPTKNPYE